MAERPACRREEAPALRRALARFRSVNQLLDHWAATQPERVALMGPRERQGWSRLSWQALQLESCQLAARLIRQGVRAGEHVGILAEGDAYVDCLVAYLAILRNGAVMVPLNPRHTHAELQHAIRFSDCGVLLVQDRLRSRMDSMQVGAGKPWRLFDLSGAAPDEARDDPVAIDTAAWPQPGADDLANIVFTSGTTARPKAVMHTHGTALATGAIFSSALGLQNSDVFHHAIPFFTSSGTQFAFMPPMWVGATLVVEPGFDATALLQRFQDEHTTAVIGVPSHYLFMLEELERRPRALPSEHGHQS